VRKLVLLGVAGLALAVGVGFAANAISRDSIGLAPTPAGSGIELSPREDDRCGVGREARRRSGGARQGHEAEGAVGPGVRDDHA
jgi:hypothetical protein